MATPETLLDHAFLAMQAAPDDASLRLRFHERMLDAELFVLLEAEAGAERLRPRVFDTEDGPVVLAFDRDARLAGFLDAPAPYAALAGRKLVAMLAGRGVGVVLNAGVAASETMLDPAAIDWLHAAAQDAQGASLRRLSGIRPPGPVDPVLVAALGTKLAAMARHFESAWLADLRHEDGPERLGLVIAGAPEDAHAPIAAAIQEAVRFCGLETVDLDVAFIQPTSPARRVLDEVGARLDLPGPEEPPPPVRDPSAPPILRRRAEPKP